MVAIRDIRYRISSEIFTLNNASILPGCRYIRIMAMIYETLLLAATVVAYKVVTIGSVHAPGSTLIYTCSFFLANVIAEVYGYAVSKRIIIESIICRYIFAFLIMIISYLPSPVYWDNSREFNLVFGHVFRFTNAGVIGYLISAYFNIYLITKWKHSMHGKLFWFRSLLASSISEGVATFIAGFITFMGMMPSEKIILIMTNALAFKILYGFIAVWPASFLAFVLKKIEHPNKMETKGSTGECNKINN